MRLERGAAWLSGKASAHSEEVDLKVCEGEVSSLAVQSGSRG
jgi:hypothetical protein